MAFFETPDYTLAYTITENAWSHDLVFLNGNLATSRWWIPTVEALKPLAGSHKTGRFIFLELPGCGESSAVTKDLEVHEIAENYLALLKTLKVDNASLIGHSTGGILACLMMAKAPEIFQKSLLLDPVGARGISFEDSVLDKYNEMMSNKDLAAIIIAFTINNCDQNSEFFKQVILEDTFASVIKVSSRMILALRDLDLTEDVKKITTPTTVLFGEKDYLLPKTHAEELAQLLGGKFTLVENAGHCLNVENPAKMAEYIRSEVF